MHTDTREKLSDYTPQFFLPLRRTRTQNLIYALLSQRSLAFIFGISETVKARNSGRVNFTAAGDVWYRERRTTKLLNDTQKMSETFPASLLDKLQQS